MEHFDIVIVGGGMVGAALAADIARRPECAHVRLAVVDAGDTPCAYSGQNFDPRVVALSEKSQQLLERVGAWSAIAERRACAYRAMYVWDGEGTASIEFCAEDVHKAQLGHIVENSVVVRALHQCLAALPAITLLQGRHVKGFHRSVDGVCELVLQGPVATQCKSVSCSMVVAADGAHSTLRDLAHIDTREWDYGQTAIVTTVKTAQPHQNTCWQRFTQQGPIALLPLQVSARGAPSECSVSLVWSADTVLADELMALDAQAFCQRLGRAVEWRLGDIMQSDQRFAISLRQRHAMAYVAPGLALVGDAAHTIHPLAGQGVNLGFYDVDALATEIDRACQRKVPLTDRSILRRYQRQRQTHNLAAMLSMEGFKRLFGADALPLRWARNTGMALLNKQLFLKKQLTKIASGI